MSARKEFNVFISWSGEPADEIAKAVEDLLRTISNTPDIRFFVSNSKDSGIPKGGRPDTIIDKNLNNADFGILILTENNHGKPWLMYEAGALANLKKGMVCPILFNRSPDNIEEPIRKFERIVYKEADQEVVKEFEELLDSIYTCYYEDKLKEDQKQYLKKALQENWENFSKEIDTILHNCPNFGGIVNDLTAVANISQLVENGELPVRILSKKENVLKEIINGLDKNSSRRIIFFGGISSTLREEESIRKFAAWLMKNKTAKLFFCHESEDAVNVRETTLSPSAYGDNTNKSKELYSRKIVEFNEMQNNLLGFIGNKVSGNVFFPEIKKPLSLYIIIVGKTFYFTSVLQKRGQMTYTFQLNHTDCCCDLLDYMKDGMAEDKEKDAFFEETELIRQELKETGDSNNVYS